MVDKLRQAGKTVESITIKQEESEVCALSTAYICACVKSRYFKVLPKFLVCTDLMLTLIKCYIYPLTGPVEYIQDMMFSHDNRYLVIVAQPGKGSFLIRMWETETGICYADLEIPFIVSVFVSSIYIILQG